MALDVLRNRTKTTKHGPIHFAELRGGPAAHASWWSFDDEQEVRDRWWHPGAGHTVLDIGAAFGSYALPALAAGARVVCFSPADFDTELLELNLSLNPELKKRCLVLRDGLFSADGFFDPDHCKFEQRVTPHMASVPHDLAKGERVAGPPWLRVRSLDAVLRDRPGIDHIRWMKIDVEGAELEVLKGARLTLEQDRPNILVENHEFQIKGIGAQVREYLAGFGYRCDGPAPHGSVSHSFYSVVP